MEWQYRAPWWMPSGHVQTIGSALWGRHRLPHVEFKRERWMTPDGDFIDVDRMPQNPENATAPLLILFHGLEGSSASHYAKCFGHECRERGWNYVVPHFRGCSGEINTAPRAYHSGDANEIGWIIERCRERRVAGEKVWAVGVSLGGNALLRWTQEMGEAAREKLTAAVSICAPLDLLAAGRTIDRGLNRHLYARMFLRTMKLKARQKWQQFPGLFDLERSLHARTIEAFDDAFTAPLHGYDGVLDYWHRASSRHHLKAIRLPTLILNPRNDPFVPAYSLPVHTEVSSEVTLWQPKAGGHVGFAQSHQRRLSLAGMPKAVCDWLVSESGKTCHG